MRALLSLLAIFAAACAPLVDDNSPPRDDGSDAGVAGVRRVDDGGADAAAQPDAGTLPDAGETVGGALSDDRDRLLDTYASSHGAADRCAAWGAFDDVQRGVFLTITDLLGRRAALTDGESALKHVTALVAVNGKKPGVLGGCGGHEYNRLYYEADDALLGAYRASGTGLSGWRASSDVAGPHAPFNQSDETEAGQPRGQVQLFSDDDHAVVLDRNGVQGILNAHIVEHDIDYDLVHNSCPECRYFGGTGRELYVKVWAALGDGGDPEFGYAPSSCP